MRRVSISVIRSLCCASTLPVIILSCGSRPATHSNISEAPTARNESTVFDVDGPFNWSEIQEPKRYSLPFTPWTDTYWPTTKKGLAFRYQEAAPEGAETFNLASYLDKLFIAVDDKDQKLLAKLSPAEKHDLLLNSDLTTFGQISRNDVIKQAAKAQKTFRADIDAISRLGESTPVKTKMMLAAIRKNANLVNTIVRNTNIFHQMPLITSSWGEWSYNVANPSYKVDGRDELDIGGVDVMNQSVEPDANNWSWEGICHGWAPAALYSKEPHHAVMATKRDGSNILFYEGDIRALLSKAWADQTPDRSEIFIGGRCESKDSAIKTDRYGRILDGTISCSGSNCGDLDKEGVALGDKFRVLQFEAQRFTLWDKGGAERFFVTQNRGDSVLSGRVFSSVADLQRWAKTRDGSIGIGVTIALQSDCRDVQPMSLHLLMTKVMAKGQGFVMDRTRSDQVWNQPVKAYEFKFVPIQGGPSNPNELTPVKDIQDDHWQIRAPRTEYLANVTATLDWIRENGPRLTYKDASGDIDDQSIYHLELKYTLEFDAQKNLIGSEWGHVPTAGNISDVESRKGQAPDFVFYYKLGAEPLNQYRNSASYPSVDYDNIVKKLHLCSLDDANLQSFVDDSGATYKYKNCPID